METNEQFKSARRMTFVSGDDNKDGKKPCPDDFIDKEVNELIVKSGGKYTYRRALDVVLKANPEVAQEYLGNT